VRACERGQAGDASSVFCGYPWMGGRARARLDRAHPSPRRRAPARTSADGCARTKIAVRRIFSVARRRRAPRQDRGVSQASSWRTPFDGSQDSVTVKAHGTVLYHRCVVENARSRAFEHVTFSVSRWSVAGARNVWGACTHAVLQGPTPCCLAERPSKSGGPEHTSLTDNTSALSSAHNIRSI
jgi:hypothetical protein